MRQTPFVVLLLLRDFSVPSEQVCLLSDNLRALTKVAWPHAVVGTVAIALRRRGQAQMCQIAPSRASSMGPE